MHRRGHGRPEPAGVQRAPTSRAAGAAERARRELTGPSSQPSHVGGVGPARGRRSPCSSPGLPHARLLLPGPPSHGDPRWLFLLRGLPEEDDQTHKTPLPWARGGRILCPLKASTGGTPAPLSDAEGPRRGGQDAERAADARARGKGLEDGEPKCACSEACARPPRSGAAPSGPLSSAAALLRAAFLLLEASRPDLPSEGRLKSSEGL